MARGRKAARGRKTAAVLGQNAIPFLIELAREKGPRPPTKVAESIDGDPKYAIALAERLAEEGLVDLKVAGKVAGKTTHLVSITSRGRQFLTLMDPVVRFFESAG